MRVVYSDQEKFEQLWPQLFLSSALQHPLYQPVNIQYYQACALGQMHDVCSFIIEEASIPLAGVYAVVGKNGESVTLSGFAGMPFLYIENKKLTGAQRQGVYKVLKVELDAIIEKYRVQHVIYQDFLEQQQLSAAGRYLLDRGVIGVPFFTQIVDLTCSEQELLQRVRKSYRSLIQWGQKNIAVRIVDHQNVTKEDIEQFRLLHAEVVGHATRPLKTWDLQYEMIKKQEAFAVLGEWQSRLVTAALLPLSSNYCFYGVSASVRQLFDKPLSHGIIWQAICYAKQQGCKIFELGMQCFQQQQDPSPKELTISTFKHGFGGQTHVRLNIAGNVKIMPKMRIRNLDEILRRTPTCSEAERRGNT